MKFSCTKENLAQALALVSGIAGKNINLPILGNVLIKIDAQKVEFVATNLELAVVVNVRSKIEEPGSFTVPARMLADYVNLLNDDRVDVELVENELSLRCGKSTTKIKGTAADDYPIVPAIDDGKGFLLGARELKTALSQVMSAVAKSEVRPELSGVYCGFNPAGYFTGLVMAATDSYRLAEKRVKLLQGQEEVKIIVPGRTAQEIGRVLSTVEAAEEGEKNVRVMVSDNQIAVHYGNVQMVSRLVDGNYPDYTQIIPKEYKTTVEFDTNKLVKEIKAASLFTTAGVNAVSVDLNVSQGTMGISSTSTQTGEYSSEIEVEASGEENSILLNHRYVLDGLANINTDRTVLKVISAESPCVIIPKGDESYLYIVMPIRK